MQQVQAALHVHRHRHLVGLQSTTLGAYDLWRYPSSCSIHFMPPSSNVSSHVDAYHQGEEVHFCAVNDIIGDTSPVGQSSRVLDDEELLLMCVEEPPTFVVPSVISNGRGPCSRRCR